MSAIATMKKPLFALVGGLLFLATASSSFANAVPTPRLHLLSGTFEPRSEKPPVQPNAGLVPAAASIAGKSGGRYYLVQFIGPVMPEWKEALRTVGAEPLNYMPDSAFITRMKPQHEAAVRALPFVRWVDRLKPEWRVHPDVLSGLSRFESTSLTIVAQTGESIEAILGGVRKDFPSVTLARPAGSDRVIVKVNPSDVKRLVEYVAQHEALGWVERWIEPRLQNNESIWVVQNGTRVAGDIGTAEYPNSAPVWAHDILGTGQVVAVADSGLTDNDCFFSPAPAHQNIAAPGALTIDNTRRKVIAYNWFPGGADGDSGDPAIGYHGSHVAGSVAGDNSATLSTSTSAGHNAGDGMAPNAKVLFQDIGGVNNLAGIPLDLRDMFTQARNGTARIHTNSWGAGVEGQYTANSQEVDDFNYRLGEDMLILFAASNDGAGVNNDKLVGGENDTIGSPATAKNTVTVGAVNNGSAGANTLIYFSSRGKTDDGRMKPDLVAPGGGIDSHDGDGTACNTQALSGTSMATPTVAGAAALARQYFVDGWYPSGMKTPADGFTPTAAALKAVLTAGARPIATEQYCSSYNQVLGCTNSTRPMTASPNSMQGWGRLTLLDSLWFASSPNSNVRLKLWDVPNASGLTTGQIAEYTLPSVISGTRLHINLVWSDAPGTLGAAKTLVNDLNLEVIAPDGTTIYRGNQWAAAADGTARDSLAGAAVWDNTNNIEGVQLAAPVAGDYRIRVHAFNVPGYNGYFQDRQGYAIAATGNFTQTCSLAAPTGLAATATANNQVSLSWTGVSGATKYAIYRSSRGEAACTNMAQIGQSSGTTFVDNSVVGGYQYSYYVKAIAPCEGAASNCATVTTTGTCTIKPTFAGLTSATNSATASCGVALSWNAGTSNCPLGSTVRYNVYRSTTPNFTPSAANRIASCVTGTSYNDSGMTSGTTYHYIVRAEDSTTGNGGACGGNEDTNTVVRSATPTGTGATTGTWTDGGGDTTAQLSLAGGWSIVSTADSASYARTGTYAYKTSPGTTLYTSSACAIASTPTLTVGANNPVVTFFERHAIEANWDAVIVQYSVNGGAWTTATAGTTTTMDDASAVGLCGFAKSTQGYEGNGGSATTLTAWTSRSFTITAAIGSTVAVRWYLATDTAVEELGFLLDDISISNIAVPNACAACTPPPTPTGVTATPNGVNRIDLGWTDVTGETEYRIYRSTGSTCPASGEALLATVTAGMITYSDTTAVGGTTYTYRIASFAVCESAKSSCATALAASCTTPAAPGTVVASTSNANTVDLSWTASATAGVTYTVYRASSCAGSFSTVASGVTPTTWSDVNIPGNTTYSYKVVAFSGSCVSADSNCVTATTTGGPGNYSRGRTASGRPMNTADGQPVRWLFQTGASALTAPAFNMGLFSVSNDRFLHSMTPPATGGNWPAGWRPHGMNGPSQGRPASINTAAAFPGLPANVVFMGSQDGFVYAANGITGAALWRKTTTPAAEMIQATPMYFGHTYGGGTALPNDLVVAGTRNSSGDNQVFALDAATGNVLWRFTDPTMGVVNGQVAFDTVGRKVFFATRAKNPGDPTLWAIQFSHSGSTWNTPTKLWAINVGDIDGSATFGGGGTTGQRLYVGNNRGELFAVNPTTGALYWSALAESRFATGDGPVKGLVSADFSVNANGFINLYFATTNKVFAVQDTGISAATLWMLDSSGGVTSPSITIFTGEYVMFGAAGGKLFHVAAPRTATPTVASITLPSASARVGSPTFNRSANLIYVGTEGGAVYALPRQ